MIKVRDKTYAPLEGYRYISDGVCFATEVVFTDESEAQNWYDTNDEPPAYEPEEELSAEEILNELEKIL